jgi:hypothetical protein
MQGNPEEGEVLHSHLRKGGQKYLTIYKTVPGKNGWQSVSSSGRMFLPKNNYSQGGTMTAGKKIARGKISCGASRRHAEGRVIRFMKSPNLIQSFVSVTNG